MIADRTGIVAIGKALMDPGQNFLGVAAAIGDAASRLGKSAETLLGETDLFIYGTTRSTNAIVTQCTARTAMLLTAGFPDILVYRQGGKLNPHQLDV